MDIPHALNTYFSGATFDQSRSTSHDFSHCNSYSNLFEMLLSAAVGYEYIDRYVLDAVYVNGRPYTDPSNVASMARLRAELSLPNDDDTSRISLTRVFYLRMRKVWPNPDKDWIYARSAVVRSRDPSLGKIVTDLNTISEQDLINRMSIKHLQEQVMSLDDTSIIINMHDMAQLRDNWGRDLARKCTPQIRSLFDDYIPIFAELIRDAIKSNLSANQFEVHIPRPDIPGWEEVDMDMWVLYMWNYKINNLRSGNGELSLNYDPSIDSLVYKFYMNDVKFRLGA